VFLIGSAAEYGNVPDGPVAETASLRPVSIYGITKAMQTMLMEFYVRNYGLDIVMARTFNLFGDGCSPLLFPGRVCDQIARVRQGLQKKIQVRSLEASRDFLHVSEAVRAYVRIMEYGKTGEVYNVGSGRAVKMTEMMENLLMPECLSIKDVEISSEDVHAKSNVRCIYADTSKLDSLPKLL
jgi:GDP-4-dehydro-6-deoxy-D-mannose reductase